MAMLQTVFDSSTGVIEKALAWRNAGFRVALATVLSTRGSAPRRAGSLMAINNGGEFCGSVSGGCVETSVIESALEAMEDGEPRRLEFGVADETAWTVGLACGGRVEVRVVPLTERESGFVAHCTELLTIAGRRQARVLAMDLQDDSYVLIDPWQAAGKPLEAAAQRAASKDESAIVEVEGRSFFLHVFNPPVRVVLLGAVHIAQTLAAAARLTGFDVTVVDHRRAFATVERFPDTDLIHLPAAEALQEMGLDARTAVVALTHKPELDDPGLIAALASPAFYIAALGSRRTHTQRLDRLRMAGVSESALLRLNGPAGVDIGAANPGEIAVSILAELISALRRGVHAGDHAVR